MNRVLTRGVSPGQQIPFDRPIDSSTASLLFVVDPKVHANTDHCWLDEPRFECGNTDGLQSLGAYSASAAEGDSYYACICGENGWLFS